MNEAAIIYDRENPSEDRDLSGASVRRISAAMNKIHNRPYCENCMETIMGKPIEIEVEVNISGNECSEIDAPVIRHLCSDECKKEYYETL